MNVKVWLDLFVSMSSFSFDFVNYAKKVWRPKLKTSSSIIDVVATNSRMKNFRKKPVELKVADIQLSTAKSFFHECYETVNGVEDQVFFDPIIRESSKYSKNDVRIRCTENFQNTITHGQKSTMGTIKIMKTKHLARKVYLEWNKYSTSQKTKDRCRMSNSSDSVSTHLFIGENHKEIHSVESRHLYLLKKYWYLWREAIVKHRSRYISPQSCFTRSSCSQKSTGSSFSSQRQCVNKNFTQTLLNAQKQKIEEQENLIKELQLLQLKLEGEKFALETRQMLDENERKCDRKLRSQLRTLSTCHANEKLAVNKYKDGWNFVTRMEVRADERKKRWDAIRQRKQQLEQERLQKLKLEEEKRRKLEEEERRRKIMQFRAEKERLADLKRKQEQERLYLCMLNSMAAEHYENLLMKLSLNGFKNHLLQAKSMAEEATQHFNRKIMFKFFTLWRLHWKLEKRKKTETADEFYEHLLLRNGLNNFKSIHNIYIRNYQVAVDFYDFSLSKNYYFRWQIFTERRALEVKKKEDIATEFYEMQILRNAFYCWRQLPRILFLEREKEHRIRLWCNKVQEVLPDFCPSYQCC